MTDVTGRVTYHVAQVRVHIFGGSKGSLFLQKWGEGAAQGGGGCTHSGYLSGGISTYPDIVLSAAAAQRQQQQYVVVGVCTLGQ